MARTPDHDAVRDLLGAYALDALDDAERGEVEVHLTSCDVCRREVAEHHEAVAALVGEGETPPPGTWDRIIAEVRRMDGEEWTPSPRSPAVRRLRRPEVWLAGAAAAAVAIIAALVALLGGDEPTSVDELLRRGYEAALDDPAAAVVELRSAEGDVAVTAVVDEDGDGFLDAADLPAAAEGRVYQLWRVHDDGAVSLGILGAEPGVAAFPAGRELGTLAVSLEAAGGATSPGQVVAVGAVPPPA